MLVYRVHYTTGDDIGTLLHPAPNLEPGDVPEVVIAPTPLIADDAIA